jgi:1,2-diacylglycerol 3-beta-glucosyltransferase
MVFEIIEIIFLFVAGSLCLYLALLSILSIFVRQITLRQPLTLHRFAIVVPAHDEELSIERTINSLNKIEYPKTHFDVIVVADNCSDRTPEIAKAIGSKVFVRTNASQRGKGYALRWCFDIILGQEYPYDAVAVVDADSVVSVNFLTVLNQYLNDGSEAIQVSDMVEPNPGNWSSEVTRLGFTLYNYVRPLGRKLLKCSAGVRGNGMCFSAKTLREMPWSTYSLNEDLEYGLVLLLNGIKTDFAPETFVLATMPSQARHAVNQRSRWEKGRFPVIKKYGMKLLSESVKKLSYRIFDAFIELITPAFVNLFGFVFVMLIITGFMVILGLKSYVLYFLFWCAVCFLCVIHVVIGLYAARVDMELLKAFLYMPKYILWKFKVYFKIFRGQSQNEWVRTTRERTTRSIK